MAPTDSTPRPARVSTSKIPQKSPGKTKTPTTRPPIATPSSFFLRKQSELPATPLTPSPSPSPVQTPDTSMPDSDMGVQSLTDTLANAFPDEERECRESREGSPSSFITDPDSAIGSIESPMNAKTRRAGNKVHPKILAAGQRIISSESVRRTSSSGSVMGKRGKEVREKLRCAAGEVRSGESSREVSPEVEEVTIGGAEKLDADITETTAMIGGASPRSLRFSDEESICLDDGTSAVLLSSSGEEDDAEEATPRRELDLKEGYLDERQGRNATVRIPGVGPQLVMPTAPSPVRRPFTEQGRRMPNLKVLVAGRTQGQAERLINRLLGECQDVVHVFSPEEREHKRSGQSSARVFSASTKPVPIWAAETRDSKAGVLLERNISMVDGSAMLCDDESTELVRYAEKAAASTLDLLSMDDSQLLELLTGRSQSQIDLAMFLVSGPDSLRKDMQHLQQLSRLTNVCVVHEEVVHGEGSPCSLIQDIDALLAQAALECTSLSIKQSSTGDASHTCRVLRATVDDNKDSSVDETDLNSLAKDILAPLIMDRLRYTAAEKLVRWHRQHRTSLSIPTLPHIMTLHDPTSSPSTISSPSGVLLPDPSSSYYHSSPSISGQTIDSALETRENSALALTTLAHEHRAQYDEQVKLHVPQWALDLQQSLASEARLRHNLHPPTERGLVCRTSATPSTSRSSSGRSPGRYVSTAAVGLSVDQDPLGIVGVTYGLRRVMVPLTMKVVGAGAVVVFVVRCWRSCQEWLALTSLSASAQDLEAGWGMGWDARQMERERWGSLNVRRVLGLEG